MTKRWNIIIKSMVFADFSRILLFCVWYRPESHLADCTHSLGVFVIWNNVLNQIIFSFKLSTDAFHWLSWKFKALFPVNLLRNHVYWEKCYTHSLKSKYLKMYVSMDSNRIQKPSFLYSYNVSHCNTKFNQTRATQTQCCTHVSSGSFPIWLSLY